LRKEHTLECPSINTTRLQFKQSP